MHVSERCTLFKIRSGSPSRILPRRSRSQVDANVEQTSSGLSRVTSNVAQRISVISKRNLTRGRSTRSPSESPRGGDSLMEIGAARRRVHPAGRVAILFLKFYLARRDILACFAGKSRARGSRIEKIARALASTVSSAVRSRLTVPFDESAAYEGNAGDLLDITHRKCYRVAPPFPLPPQAQVRLLYGGGVRCALDR